MKDAEISFKDMSRAQLEALKDTYIDGRVNSMSDLDLRNFVREVLDIQVKGAVGNEEEREVWEEMKEHFSDNFEEKVKEVMKIKGSDNVSIPPEEEEFQRRLEILKQREKENIKTNPDMW